MLFHRLKGLSYQALESPASNFKVMSSDGFFSKFTWPEIAYPSSPLQDLCGRFPCPGVRPASGENGGVSVDQKWSNKGSDVQSKSIDSKRQKKKTSCQI